MTTSAVPSATPAPGSGQGCRVGIVAAQWHADIVDNLLSGAVETLRDAGVAADDIVIVRVPGSYEIPVAVRVMIDAQRVDAVITLGLVVRGETAHFEYVASPVAHTLMDLSASTGVPCLFGVLTTETIQQAWDRTGGVHGHKGRESAAGALEMIAVVRQLRSNLP
jgi:6,7-dimethyl-8-ribityllumazine synthase